MKHSGIREEKSQGLAWVILDGPEQGNAPDAEAAQALRDICQELAHDDAVRVVLLTGAGEQFCVAPPSPVSWPLAPDPWQALACLRIAAPVAELEKPVIAVINGPALGQGLELALACDLRLACPEARFSLPHVRAGLLPWDGGTQRLSRVVGRAWALELLLTGREVDAHDALEMGLVHQVVPKGQLQSQAKELAERIAACAPIALRYLKEAVLHGMDLDLQGGLRLEADLSILLHSTQDRAEGIRSFLERRPPRFHGH